MENPTVEQQRAELAEVNQQPFGKRLAYYTKKSGPGWLQAAITLGGGSLAGALYLGVFTGYTMMWVQPLAMIVGVIMLSAISYVTLTTGERPFRAVQEHVSPVLAWAWIIATLMASFVWCMPQFALGSAAVQQNLGGGGIPTVVICLFLLAAAFTVNIFYERGSRGIFIFEVILKIMVGIIVLSFFGVVVALSASGALDWGAVFSGLIPNFSLLGKPAATFSDAIAATGDYASHWKDVISSNQRDIMITAFGTAVGINMTFLLPYSMLKKSWGREHRPMAIFDLSIGLIIPFVLATGCVVIAAASQFHTKFDDVLSADGQIAEKLAGPYHTFLDGRLKAELGEDEFNQLEDPALAAARNGLPLADKQMAAMLVKRDNFQLANALEPLTGATVAQGIFGVGVFGMALSTIIILMLISGFAFTEMFNKPGNRNIHLAGCLLTGISGFLGPLVFWSNANAKAALAVPTSVIGGSMIPIAYFTFLLLMNSRKTLGDNMIQGRDRMIWNALMIASTALATVGSVWVLNGKGTAGNIGIAILAILFILGAMGFLSNERKAKASAS